MYLRRERVGILDRQLEMLGRDAVDQRHCLVPVGDDQDRAVRLPARPRDVGPRQVLEMARGGRLDGCGELAAVGH